MTSVLLIASVTSALEVIAVIAAAVIFLAMVAAFVALIIWTFADVVTAANHPPPTA